MAPIDTDRPLTAGEVAICAQVFGPALNPALASIRRRKFWPLHPRRVTMAPDGHVWCHPDGDNWCSDYAAAALGLRAHFVHEMVHVWQHQQGRRLMFERLPLARYRYRLVVGKPFQRYGIEQQACIVADAYRLLETGDRAALAPYAAILPFGAW
jgi:hypothetical protein